MKDTNAQLKDRFLEAYATHADAIFRYCFFRLGDKEKVTDLVQDIFMKTWEYMRTGQVIGNMRAFLYTTASHIVIDEYRKRKPQESLDTLLVETGFEPSVDDSDRHINELDGAEAMELLHLIPESYSEVIFMRYVEELSLSEISDILGESENTIAVRVHRGIGMLRKLWDHEK